MQRAFSLLSADLASGKIAGAYLFAGPSAREKKSASLEFAKALNCQKTDPRSQIPDTSSSIQHPASSIQFCGACQSCRKINEGTHPDLFILNFENQARLLELNSTQTEKQKEYHIDAVRGLIRSSTLTPAESKWKIFVIEGAELLSLESANALLKALEEPTPFSCWILLASNSERILPTVRSRCRKILFCSKDSNEHEKDFPEIKQLAQSFLEGRKEPLKIASDLLKEKKEKGKGQVESFLEILAMHYSDKLYEKPTEKTANELFQILQAREDLKKNANPQFVLDALLTELKPNV